ncbi:adenylate/guanylate cyclase domain-containing protein [Limisphaera ngatamarikiensis]|uniref:Adenylate/guanylate cyclase domain-containing protein n=1 Tax=Limisphaera ngatamarikiensis TaxID=1324935 RepID=A0A6M1RE11_9BACT|nr:adenylate/guanylate cyclase domain-containing protein [Limisphaera ngatamarikiensis]
MKVPRKYWLPATLTALTVAVAALPMVFSWGPVERVEAITYDWRVRWAAGRGPVASTNLGFVDINDESIRLLKTGALDPRIRYGLYWPRHVYGRVLRELHAQGARAVAFDILFAEAREDHAPVRLPAGEVGADSDFWAGLPPALRPSTFQEGGRTWALVDSDVFFAWQLHRTGIGILAADRGVLPYPLLATNAVAVADISAHKDLDGVLRRVRAFTVYRVWHPLFLKAADEFGVDLQRARVEARRIVLTMPDGTELPPIELDAEGCFALRDLVGDTLPPGWPERARPFEERRIWHMGIVLAAQALGLDLDHAEVDLDRGRIVLRGPGVERVIPVDREGFFHVDWTIQPNHPALVARNFVELLAQDLERESGRPVEDSSVWKGRLVVVGSTATGNDLTDLGATPLARETFLLSKHWNVANSILTGRFVRRSGPWLDLACLTFLAGAAALLTLGLRPPWVFAGLGGVGVAYAATALWAYDQHRLWLPMVVPLVGGLGLTHAVLMAWQVLFEQREKRRIRAVFSRIVSPNVVQELLQAPSLSLGGQRREVTIFFADIRGFTELTDRVHEEAERLVQRHGWSGARAEACHDEYARATLSTVNEYLACVAEVIKRHDGTLDKYIGDCVMAFWGAPTSRPDHAAACVRAAIEAQRAVRALNERRLALNRLREKENEQRLAEGLPPLPLQPVLYLGTGIHTGHVTVGLMGSDRHLLNYTVFGRDVNLASRLENVSGRSRILITQATHAHLVRFAPELARRCRALEPVLLRGFREPVAIFEVLWDDGQGGPGPDSAVAGGTETAGSAGG